MSKIEDIKTTPVHVTEIKSTGAESFDPAFLEQILSPLTNSDVQTIADLENQGNKVLKQLNFLGVTRPAVLEFSKSNGEVKKDLYGEPLINVIGKLDTSFNTGSNLAISTVHNELGNALGFQYINRNVFKKAELFQFNALLNFFNDSKSVDLLYSKPLRNTAFKGYARLNLLNTHDITYKSSSQDSTSAELGFIKQHYSKCSGALTQITTGLSLVKRNINEIADSAEDEIKTYAGTNMKRSVFVNLVSSNMTYLTKSNFTLPLSGYALSMDGEASGFMDSSEQDRFIKSSVGATYAKSILAHALTFSTDVKVGTIVNFADTVNFQDKYYPFVPGHALPVTAGNSFGAGSFASYNVGVHARCGFVGTEQPLRAYASVQGARAGNQIDARGGNGVFDGVKGVGAWKNGVDVGLVYSTGDANAKLCYTVPVAGDGVGVGKFGFEVELNGEW